jgi:hypothetical protein
MPRLTWGDTITYTQATGWYHADQQPPEDGPYTGGIVGFEENGLGGTVIQVRADGWMGDAPIYAVEPADIIDTATSHDKENT